MTLSHHQSDWCPLYWEWLMQHIYGRTQGMLAKTWKKKMATLWKTYIRNSTICFSPDGRQKSCRMTRSGWQEVNVVSLAQRRSAVDEALAWAFRRSIISWWEAPSATFLAVCPFWVEKAQKKKSFTEQYWALDPLTVVYALGRIINNF